MRRSSQSGLGRVLIDLDALRHNVEQLRTRLGGVPLLAIVKADAYGHGASVVALTLTDAGVTEFGVSYVDEAIELRRAGVEKDILVLQGIRPEHAGLAVEHRLSPLVYTPAQIEALSDVAVVGRVTVPVHLKVDTGMTRLGVGEEQLLFLLKQIDAAPGVELVGVCSHLAMAEEWEAPFNIGQLERFRRVATRVRAYAPGIRLHLANSAAALQGADARYDMVRVGLCLYGLRPAPAVAPELDLRPVMSWKTELISVRTVPPGTRISYGARYEAKRACRIGVIPVGYSDGLPRQASNRGQVLVGGVKCPIVGSICMDMCMVDITEAGPVGPGVEVVIIGRQGQERLTADDLARAAGTLSYDILCGIGTRSPKRVVRDGIEPGTTDLLDALSQEA